jgi:octaprenyl-diphosphate synthase
MAISLNEIKKPINEELNQFEKHFRDSMKSPVALLDKITYYIVKRKGKQVRPMFVFLVAKSLGEINESSFVAASLVELLHTATLVHDDVVDDSLERRGFFSINALWKNKIAVLVGDFLFSRGFLLALDNKEFRLLQILSRAVKEMSEGELLQIEKARKLDIKEDVYFDIIRQKTATLIASACSAGAASITDDEEMIETARLLGEYIGIAFQIKDDLFDFGDQDVGKPLGIDIQEKKMTLPIIYLLDNSDRATKRKIINIIKRHNTDKEKVDELITMVRQSGGLEYATQKMEKYKELAFEQLDKFPDNECKDALKKLVAFVTERTK